MTVGIKKDGIGQRAKYQRIFSDYWDAENIMCKHLLSVAALGCRLWYLQDCLININTQKHTEKKSVCFFIFVDAFRMRLFAF